MENNLEQYNIRMPIRIAEVFNKFALLLGYKSSSFIFSCAIDGLISKVGREEYFDMLASVSGDLLPEPSVDARETAEG